LKKYRADTRKSRWGAGGIAPKQTIVSLSSASSLSDVQAVYDDNVDYDLGQGDETKAQNFIVACRMLLRRLPGDSSFKESRTTLQANLLEIRQQLQRAQLWLQQSQAANGGAVTFGAFENFRN
jgi:hypothetical protein